MDPIQIRSDFFERDSVTEISRDLLGKYLCTKIDGIYCTGMITETEAYAGITDKASHAYQGTRTKRTEVMFGPAGTAYIYLCYGMHHLFNIVTNNINVPHAVLIRSIQPQEGIDQMIIRRKIKYLSNKKDKRNTQLCGGPGMLCQALGINKSHSGIKLSKSSIWIEDRGPLPDKCEIISSPRIGIDYAEEDAHLPYRFNILSAL